jgi:antirestriction protein ArdC
MATQDQIRDQITNQIIEALDKGGIPPWRQNWLGTTNTGRPANIASKKTYSGINPLLLSLHQQRHNLRSRWYGTFRQIQDVGGRVMRRPDDVPPGAWACSIIYYCPVAKTVTDPITGEETEEKYPVLKTYSVFSIDQVEGDHLDHLRARDEGPLNDEFVDFEPAERAIAATEADIRYIGDRAFYNKGGDYIQVPPKNRYFRPSEFYSTCFHELAHWSEKRTDWTGEYAINELRADIAAAYMLAELGVPQSSDLTNHQSYVKGWLQALRNDSRYIFRASTAANKAADYVLSFSRQPEPVLEEIPF